MIIIARVVHVVHYGHVYHELIWSNNMKFYLCFNIKTQFTW